MPGSSDGWDIAAVCGRGLDIWKETRLVKKASFYVGWLTDMQVRTAVQNSRQKAGGLREVQVMRAKVSGKRLKKTVQYHTKQKIILESDKLKDNSPSTAQKSTNGDPPCSNTYRCTVDLCLNLCCCPSWSLHEHLRTPCRIAQSRVA